MSKKNKRRVERLTILLTAEEKAKLQRDAKRSRQTVSGVVRDAIIAPPKVRA